MSVVYVVQEVFRKNKYDKWVRAHNFSSAHEYGQIKILYRTSAENRSTINIDDMIEQMELGLSEFTDNDYLLPVGAPECIAAAAAIAARNTGGYLTMLRWNDHEFSYDPVELDLWSNDEVVNG